ncbi:uncharacterized protein LOC127265989 [Andrographis paniculata]|uniref:uncharacterized protein LOC127265989 n=1 Tax=Andrographis paniculata TaxID=175694 RepID=UPI0021E86A5D|nr:uncharacterized protein LOC127265989 [Andrographis paniculata]
MPDPNPKEHCKALTLRNKKQLPDPYPNLKEFRDFVEESTNWEEKGAAREGEMAEKLMKDKNDELHLQKIREKGMRNLEEKSIEEKGEAIKAYQPRIPYPSRLRTAQEDKNFSKFLEVFKKLCIDIPFSDAIAQMPVYAKFLKEILSKKRSVDDDERVALIGECSAVLQRKLPIKQKDLGSYTIPCVIGTHEFSHALCDLGSSINLIPYSIFRELGVGVVKPTRMQLQLADRSIRTPLGIVEDVPVQVEDFIFPVDFVILDMKKYLDMPLILGRPFLQTGRAMVDMDDGKITLKVGEEQVSFDVAKTIQMPKDEMMFTLATKSQLYI